MTAKKRGRPSSFRPEYVEQARELALLGLTDEEMAPVFGVAESTFNRWKTERPEFWDSIKKGRLVADAKVSASLYQRACGYSHPAVKILTVAGVVERVPYTEHYPPDTAAAFIWLKNRQPKLWREKQPEAADGDEKPEPKQIVFTVTDASA